ncbi:hypothetical protein FI667_g4673, partial [Globisporangium splendens]
MKWCQISNLALSELPSHTDVLLGIDLQVHACQLKRKPWIHSHQAVGIFRPTRAPEVQREDEPPPYKMSDVHDFPQPTIPAHANENHQRTLRFPVRKHLGSCREQFHIVQANQKCDCKQRTTHEICPGLDEEQPQLVVHVRYPDYVAPFVQFEIGQLGVVVAEVPYH